MSAVRTAARRAWALSLSLHGAVLTGLFALPHRPPEAAGPVVINTRVAGDHPIGLVLLDEPAPRPTATAPPPAPNPLPPVPALPVPVASVPAPPPLPTPTPTAAVESVTPAVRPVSHSEPKPPPGANAPGSPGIHPKVELPPGAATAFLGVPAVGKSVVFVIDRSGTMGLADRLARARREVAASLRLLPPSARFQVIAYNKAAGPMRVGGQDGLLPAAPDTIAAAVARLDGLSAEGGTDHLRALQLALNLRPDVIYFLTDEDDLTLGQVREVARLNRGACIHALCLVPPRPGSETPMQRLAQGNRGVFKVVGW